jgi:hypothetical protein
MGVAMRWCRGYAVIPGEPRRRCRQAQGAEEPLDYAKLLSKLGTGARQLRAPPHLLATRSNIPSVP